MTRLEVIHSMRHRAWAHRRPSDTIDAQALSSSNWSKGNKQCQGLRRDKWLAPLAQSTEYRPRHEAARPCSALTFSSTVPQVGLLFLSRMQAQTLDCVPCGSHPIFHIFDRQRNLTSRDNLGPPACATIHQSKCRQAVGSVSFTHNCVQRLPWGI